MYISNDWNGWGITEVMENFVNYTVEFLLQRLSVLLGMIQLTRCRIVERLQQRGI
jgi:hypothetical protein